MLTSILLLTAAYAGDPAVESHLNEVVTTLRAETPSTLSPEQRAARLELLDLLQGYADAGEYPEHDGAVRAHPRSIPAPRQFEGPGQRSPVFVDADGTHCAVGYLMAATDPALVERIVTAENDAYVLEMHTPGIEEWAFEHGLSADDLAWIQPSYAHTPIAQCQDLELPSVGQTDRTFREEPMLALSGLACHTCGGDLSVYVQVWNVGASPSEPTTIDVRLGAAGTWQDAPDGELLDTFEIPVLEGGSGADVGEVEVTGSLNRLYNDDLDVYVVLREGTRIELDQDFSAVWVPDRGFSEHLYPEACDEVRDPPPPPAYDEGGLLQSGCLSAAAPVSGTSILLGLALFLAGRRRR